MDRLASSAFRTETEFNLPKGYIDETGVLHRHGVMRLATAADEILPLRDRMRVTREEFCWKCHQRMDPLGLAFEMFDHWGRYRTEEMGKPADPRGEVIRARVKGTAARGTAARGQPTCISFWEVRTP